MFQVVRNIARAKTRGSEDQCGTVVAPSQPVRSSGSDEFYRRFADLCAWEFFLELLLPSSYRHRRSFSKITTLWEVLVSQRMPTRSKPSVMATCNMGRCWFWHSNRKIW